MSDYLKSVGEVEDLMVEYGYELQALGKAFHTTGNEYMGDTLMMIGRELLINQKKLSNTVALEINDRLNTQKEDLGNTLTAVFENINKSLQ